MHDRAGAFFRRGEKAQLQDRPADGNPGRHFRCAKSGTGRAAAGICLEDCAVDAGGVSDGY